MSRRATLKHEFVEYIPAKLEEGRLYVSVVFATAAHLCCCGCRHEVVTPLSPTDWELAFNGESVSLAPSIGNWSFECRSHYWIKRGRVLWARTWSDGEIARVRALGARRREEYCHRERGPLEADGAGAGAGPRAPQPARWEGVREWWRKLTTFRSQASRE
jgi:hypothetical protein